MLSSPNLYSVGWTAQPLRPGTLPIATHPRPPNKCVAHLHGQQVSLDVSVAQPLQLPVRIIDVGNAARHASTKVLCVVGLFGMGGRTDSRQTAPQGKSVGQTVPDTPADMPALKFCVGRHTFWVHVGVERTGSGQTARQGQSVGETVSNGCAMC
jgi:hypothetical protein